MGCPVTYGEQQEHTLGWEQGSKSRPDEQTGMDFGKTRCQKKRLFLTQVSLGCCRQMMGAHRGQRWRGRGADPGALCLERAGCGRGWRIAGPRTCGGQGAMQALGEGRVHPDRSAKQHHEAKAASLQHPQDSGCQLQGAALMHAFPKPGEGLPGIPPACSVELPVRVNSTGRAGQGRVGQGRAGQQCPLRAPSVGIGAPEAPPLPALSIAQPRPLRADKIRPGRVYREL